MTKPTEFFVKEGSRRKTQTDREVSQVIHPMTQHTDKNIKLGHSFGAGMYGCLVKTG